MEFNSLIRFFCFCSGASLQVLKECPIELNKYTSIGATVFFTGILAAISGSYALYSIFHNAGIAVFFGIFWGLLIFNLDRYIVASLKKNGSKWKELLTALPRLLVAIVISVVIAKPLEVSIFQDRVQRQIHENMLHKLVDDKIKIDEIYEQDRIEKEIILKNNELANFEKTMNALPEGKSFEKLYLEMKETEASYKEITSSNTKRIKQLQKNISKIYTSQPNRLFDAKGRLIAESISPEAYRRIQAFNREAYILKQKTKLEEKKYVAIKQKVDTLIAQYHSQINDRLLQAKKELSILNNEKAIADSLAYAQFTHGNKINKKTYQANFITQLEALGSLTKDRFSTMWWASLFISFLFILVETSPIVVKLIAQKGPYELILERYEYQIMLDNKKKISLLKGEISQKHFLELLHKEANEKEESDKHVSLIESKPKKYETHVYNTPTVRNNTPIKDIPTKKNKMPKTYSALPLNKPEAEKSVIEKPLQKNDLLAGITWKIAEAKDAFCYVFRINKTNHEKEFVLIANGDVSYGKWDYSDKSKIWIELSGKKKSYKITGLNSHYLQLKEHNIGTVMTFKRM